MTDNEHSEDVSEESNNDDASSDGAAEASTGAAAEDDEEAGAEAESEGASSPAPAGGSIVAGKRVLVVDDSKPIRRFLAMTLRNAGAETEEADNGRAGVTFLHRGIKEDRPHDLVMLDLNMPIMSGYDFLEHIRKDDHFRALPVVVVTTEAERESIMRCAKFGINGYLLKPSPTGRIVEAAEEALTGGASSSTSGDDGEPGSADDAAPKGDAESADASPGLTLDQVREMRTVCRNAAEAAVDAGMSKVGNPEKDPVFIALNRYLDATCPDAKG